MRLAVTGHRPPKLGGYYQPNRVSTAVRNALFHWFSGMRDELEMVYLGMAVGTDQWTAEVCISLGIPFFACVPFLGFESRWPPRVQDRYRELLAQATDRIVVTPREEYRAVYLQARNQWMVDRADQLLAVFNGVRAGGTWNCIRYAETIGKMWYGLVLPDEVWTEARQAEIMLNERMQERAVTRAPNFGTLYGGFTPADRDALVGAVRARADELPADPPDLASLFPAGRPQETPIFPPGDDPQPTGALPRIPIPQPGFRLLRRRREARLRDNPTVRVPAGSLDLTPEQLREFNNMPIVPMPPMRGAPTQEQQKQLQEAKDRFKPGRSLELDED